LHVTNFKILALFRLYPAAILIILYAIVEAAYFLYILKPRHIMPGLEINWFRAEKGYDPNIIRKSLERRYRDPKIVDAIIEKDLEWRKSINLPI
jgi:hypothetical protein